MFNKLFLKLICLAIVGISLTSCLATKPYKKPNIDTKNLYPFHKVSMDSTSLAEMPWQKIFKDPQLRQLINEALKNNLNLKSAIQQIRVAQARFYSAKMSLFPSLTADAQFTRNKTAKNSLNFGGANISIPTTNQYSLPLQSSWELPIWGKLNSAKKASLAALLQTQATRRAIQTTLIAQVADTYYRILAYDKQLKVVRQTVKNRKQDVKTVKALKKGAIENGVSVQQSIANRYAAQVTIPQLKQQITVAENALDMLLGRKPGPIKRTTFDQQQPIDSLATGVPAQLLQNRPDVLAAEYSFRQAFELTNNARAYFYPSLTLTAKGGFQSLKTENLFKPGSLFYNLVAGLTEPIFNKGQNRARLKSAKARQKQALYGLRDTVLNAAREVTNALSQFKHAKRQVKLSQKQLTALKKAVSYSRTLMRNGEVNYTQVLTAQQNLLSAQISHINDKLQELLAGVSLYQALGGGWDKSAGIGGKHTARPDTTKKQKSE
ncbi:MAG TPA: TolC family protein [Balneolaceae bacterium]|nr:TolC family protein [Balneolaceae bacterium]